MIKRSLLALILLSTPALADPNAIPANEIMASPSGAAGPLSPRALTITDLPALAFSNLIGNIAVGQMNSGTGASSSTYWRGDGTWASVPSSALVVGTTTVTGTCTTGQFLYNNAGILACQTLAGGGNVSNTGTPVAGQLAIWASATTIKGQVPTVYSSPVMNSAGTVAFSPVFDVMAAGATGNGTIDDTSAIQAAFTAAGSSGGQVRFPCGTYKVTSAVTLSIPSNKNVAIVGGGPDCTTIATSGNVGGFFAITYGNANSSVTVRGLTATTDQAGLSTFLTLTQTASSNLINAVNNIADMNFIGDNLYTGVKTHYWGFSIKENNVSNINHLNINYNGGNTSQGNLVLVQGLAASSFYAVVNNYTNVTITNCGDGIQYGDWVQGLQIVNSNFTGCTHGVNVLPSATGNLSQLAIVNSQFGFNTYDIYMQSFVDNLKISNNYMLDNAGAFGTIVASSYYTITGNTIFSSTGGLGGTPLHITNTGGGTHGNNSGTITGNSFFNLATAILVDSGASPNIGPNSFNAVTTPINNGSTNTTTSSYGIVNAGNTPAGYVGEYISNSASGVSMLNNVQTNVASVSLTPGDWRCAGAIGFTPTTGGAFTWTQMTGGFNTTSATAPAVGTNGANQFLLLASTTSGINGFPQGLSVSDTRFNVSTTTTVYLVGSVAFGGSITISGNASMNCLRTR